ncbi:MAG TPA: helix-turn-helix transcriptional regulator [Clostridia bacterium]|nr:helix-turn-helix transcriptional regulator [Clostridia bacterium]
MFINSLPALNLEATGRNIKRLRKENGYTVRDLQAIFRFNEPQAIYKWQRGDCLPTVENLLVLSQLFGLPIEGILVFDEVPFSSANVRCLAGIIKYIRGFRHFAAARKFFSIHEGEYSQMRRLFTQT